jgi:MYXO-CTERM domain-containing protein
MSTRSFGPLPFAAEEGRAVKSKLAGATLWMGAEATESAVKSLQGPPVLHIATHGFFLPDQPQRRDGPRSGAKAAPVAVEDPLVRSGLAFAGANSRHSGADDGVLTALEVSGTDLYGTQLVVLSGCETAVGDVVNGEGVYGLRRALVLAGSRTQVMSLWRVDDAATQELMTAYYGRLQKGDGRSEAMRQVQLAMLAQSERARPYYWASFIVSGDWAALDGKAVVPQLGRVQPVQPGPRGCACAIEAGPEGRTATWAAAVALGLGLARRRARRWATPRA